jgi:hypothetical protein
MTMRFRPANIRVINRRDSSSLSSALLSAQQTLKAHQREQMPASFHKKGKPVLAPDGAKTGDFRSLTVRIPYSY